MQHFFVNAGQVESGENGAERITVTGSDVNHIKNVLRMKKGEQLCINTVAADVFASCEYLCRIKELNADEVLLEVLETREQQTELSSRIYLFQGLAKGDKMDTIVQKAVELGVYEVIPVSMARSIVKLDEKRKAARQKRWQAIAESAAKQSGRGIIPQVKPVMTLPQAYAYAKAFDLNMIPYEMEHGMTATKETLSKIKSGLSVGIFIGPEGGFEESEVLQAKDIGVYPISLGKRILQTETAGLCILSILMYLLETESES